jgi:hypothetical protein
MNCIHLSYYWVHSVLYDHGNKLFGLMNFREWDHLNCLSHCQILKDVIG